MRATLVELDCESEVAPSADFTHTPTFLKARVQHRQGMCAHTRSTNENDKLLAEQARGGRGDAGCNMRWTLLQRHEVKARDQRLSLCVTLEILRVEEVETPEVEEYVSMRNRLFPRKPPLVALL